MLQSFTSRSLPVARESHATEHHVFGISVVSRSLEVNRLGDGGKEHGKARNPQQNAHDQVQPERIAEAIATGHRHVRSTRAVAAEYRNSCHVHQTCNTLRFNGYFPSEPRLAGCPLNSPYTK